MRLGEEGAYVVWHPKSPLSPPDGKSGRPAPLLGHQGSCGPTSCRGEKTTFPRKVSVCGFSKKPQIRFPHPSRIHGFTFVPLPLPFVPRSWCQDYFELKAEAQRSLLGGACLPSAPGKPNSINSSSVWLSAQACRNQ